MDDATRNLVLTAAEELFDTDKLLKLASSVGEARNRKGLRYWQETMLKQLSDECGIDVTKKTNFIAAFKGTKQRYAPDKPDNSAAGMLRQMQALWADNKERDRWIQWAARDLSKIGTLDSYLTSYRALAKFLDRETVLTLYNRLRDDSMRAESEWRHEFVRYFKKTIADSDLPESLGDDHWMQFAVDPKTLPMNPQTGLPWDDE